MRSSKFPARDTKARTGSIAWQRYLFCIMFLLALTACASDGGSSANIELAAPGQTLYIADQLQGLREPRIFTFFARAGTCLKVELSGEGAIRGVVIFPSGVEEGGPGGVILNQALTESGSYRLRVEESPMGEAWRGGFKVRIDTRRC
jgi:hypothetical protein